jgi:hypothetical protein
VCSGGLDGQGGQVQPRRPPLGSAVELGCLAGGEAHVGGLQQIPRLAQVHRQVSRSHLDESAMGAQPRQWQPRPGTRSQGQLGPAGELHRELLKRVQALAVMEQLDVVKDQGDRLGRRRHDHGQPGNDRGRNVGRRRCQHVEGLKVDRCDPVQRHRQVGQQHRRVVVAWVDCDPTDPVTLALGPLGQQGRLAVAGRRHNTDHRPGRCSQQPFDQRRAGHDPRPQPGRVQLGLDELERRPVPGSPAMC